MITRRQLLRLSVSGMALAPWSFSLSGAELSDDWKSTCKIWLQVLMPSDETGAGGDSAPVWDALHRLMMEADFAEGFKTGMAVLKTISPPKHGAALTEFMMQGTPIAHFLNAFFEIVVEAYYSSAEGWLQFGIAQPPQPAGFSK